MLLALLLSLGGIPGAAAVVSLEVPSAPWELAPGETRELELVVKIQPGWHISGPEGAAGALFPTRLEISAPPGLEVGEPRFPDPQVKPLAWSESPLPLYLDRISISLPVTASSDLPPGEYRLEGKLTYQACDDETCLLPQELSWELPVLVRPREGGGAVALPPGPGGENPLARLAEERGLTLVLGMVFLLGLGLNLTPCVYPLIPVTVAYFGRGKTGVRHTLPAALAYQLGIAITYTGLGLLAAFTGRLFGELLQRPWVPALTAGVLVAMALSFFGLYQLKPPRLLTRRLPQARGRVVGALVMGLLVGAVAAPCVGPATVALLSYVGASQSLLLGGALFFVFALGLGAPYLGLALVSGKLRDLPRGGEWTLWVERGLGLLLLGAALYFLSPLLPGAVISGLAGGLALIGGIYLAWQGRKTHAGRWFQALRWVTLGAGLTLGLWFLLPHPGGESLPWAPYSSAGMAEARADGQPVLLYFAADWCQPCRKLAATTFQDPGVREELADWQLMKVDLTRPSPEAQRLVAELGVRGVPTLVFFSPGEELLRLVGYVGPAELLAALEEASLGGETRARERRQP